MNCKPNTLAYIVKSAFPDNIGIVVEVQDFWGHHPVDGPCWNIRSRTPMVGYRYGDHVVQQDLEGFTPDFCLRPISGVPVPDDVTDEVTA